MPAHQTADEPVYVVTPKAVHVVPKKDLTELRAHPCRPREELPFDDLRPFALGHCFGGPFLNGKVTNMASDGAGAAWDRTTFAATAGIYLWGYGPRSSRMELELDYGGGSGRDYAFGLDYAIGPAFSVPGLALRSVTSVALRSAPEYFHSRLQLPGGELAWVFADGTFAAELGARGALVAIGRFNLHDSSERLGAAPSYGPYGKLAHRGAHLRTTLDAHLLRIERDPPFHELAARFCSGTGELMICAYANQRWMAQDQQLWNLAEASSRATTMSLSVGYTTF